MSPKNKLSTEENAAGTTEPKRTTLDWDKIAWWNRADHTACTVCGKPLEGVEEIDIAYLQDHSEHVRCHDWSETSWPFIYDVATMRALYRVLPRVQRELARAGRELVKIEAQWPGKTPADLLIAARRQLSWVKGVVRKAKILRGFRCLDDGL